MTNFSHISLLYRTKLGTLTFNRCLNILLINKIILKKLRNKTKPTSIIEGEQYRASSVVYLLATQTLCTHLKSQLTEEAERRYGKR